VEGVFTFTVQVNDSWDMPFSAEAVYTLTINPARFTFFGPFQIAEQVWRVDDFPDLDLRANPRSRSYRKLPVAEIIAVNPLQPVRCHLSNPNIIVNHELSQALPIDQHNL
jgi:hypothetical protein